MWERLNIDDKRSAIGRGLDERVQRRIQKIRGLHLLDRVGPTSPFRALLFQLGRLGRPERSVTDGRARTATESAHTDRARTWVVTAERTAT